jgi:hypothetical protein
MVKYKIIYFSITYRFLEKKSGISDIKEERKWIKE